MLMTGQDYLDSIRDGRRVYLGGELVEEELQQTRVGGLEGR